MMPSALALTSCNPGLWARFLNFSTWTIQSEKDWSFFSNMSHGKAKSGHLYAVTVNLII